VNNMKNNDKNKSFAGRPIKDEDETLNPEP
jgi:hypothetical protein